MGEVHLDTDVLIDLLEREPLDRVKELAERYDLKVSAIVYFEFMVGAHRAGRGDLGELLREHVEVLPVAPDVADKAAEIEADLMGRGEPIDPRDLMVAATAMVRGAPLWTRNERHYERLVRYGLELSGGQ